MNRFVERLEGLENLISYLDDFLFYLNLKFKDIPKDILNHQSNLLDYFKERYKKLKTIEL